MFSGKHTTTSTSKQQTGTQSSGLKVGFELNSRGQFKIDWESV